MISSAVTVRHCKTGESEAGSLLTVDHFCPRSRGGKDEESNWVYCCFACNSFKAAFWAEGEAALLHPQRDEQASHWSEQTAFWLRLPGEAATTSECCISTVPH